MKKHKEQKAAANLKKQTGLSCNNSFYLTGTAYTEYIKTRPLYKDKMIFTCETSLEGRHIIQDHLGKESFFQNKMYSESRCHKELKLLLDYALS